MARAYVTATWDDAPHLSHEEKELMMAALAPHQRDARSKGVPSLGSGVIYPVAPSTIEIEPFSIPDWYERFAGMDVGWNYTAVVWFARDPNTGVTYIYDCYKGGQAEPATHAHAIRSRGAWIPIAIDPASSGRSQRDGEVLFDDYFDLGLDLVKADNAVESGIYTVWQGLSGQQLRVFKSCEPWFKEHRLYRRNELGKIVKENDHLMDATRYGYVTGRTYAIPVPFDYDEVTYTPQHRDANPATGY